VLAPAATPREIVKTLSRAIAVVSHSADWRRQLFDLGEEPEATEPEEFATVLREQTARWSQVIRAAGIQGD